MSEPSPSGVCLWSLLRAAVSGSRGAGPFSTSATGPALGLADHLGFALRHEDMGGDMAGPALKLAGPLAARPPGLRLALAHEIERHCGADEILQGRLIDLAAFVDVDGAPGIPVEAGVE
jgi:hypothetical protein